MNLTLRHDSYFDAGAVADARKAVANVLIDARIETAQRMAKPTQESWNVFLDAQNGFWEKTIRLDEKYKPVF